MLNVCFNVFLLNTLEGRPVYIVRLGTMDFKGLLKTVGEDGFVKHVNVFLLKNICSVYF